MMIEAVSREAFEAELKSVRVLAFGEREGVFGPASVIWRVDREAAMFLGAGRALLLQLAHPWVAAAIAEHSRTFDDPIGRFHRTFGVVFSMVFGLLDQAIAAARRLHRRHAAIQGRLATAVGPFAAGSGYQANEIMALQWVHATLVDEERKRYYGENKLLAALFGIPRDCLPSDWTGFAGYNETMWESNTLTISPAAREIAQRLLSAGGTWLCPPQWYRSLTVHLLPSRLRQGFGLPYDSAERRLAEGALAWIRRFYPALPERLRYVGPYQEAMARLSGRAQPDLATQALNRFWIGQRWLA